MATLVGNIRGPQGIPGQDGAPGANGENGATGAQGPPGERGPEGPAGTGFNMRGRVADEAALNQIQDPAIGDAYITEDTGELFVWDGADWISMGDIQGPEGPPGQPGTNGTNGTNGQDGAPGATGPRGSGWFTGTGPPSEPVGGSLPGDLYLDTASGNVYTLAGA
jgi:hypothetical protein